MPAALVYLLVLGAFLVLMFSPSAQFGDAARMLLGSAAPLLGFAAVWFVGLQGIAVRRFCLYCLLLHVIGMGIAGLVLFDPALEVRVGAVGWAVAACAAAALVLGQVLVEPRMYRIGKVVSGRSAAQAVALSAATGLLESRQRESASSVVKEVASGQWSVASDVLGREGSGQWSVVGGQ